jgi:hypothetical protein
VNKVSHPCDSVLSWTLYEKIRTPHIGYAFIIENAGKSEYIVKIYSHSSYYCS